MTAANETYQNDQAERERVRENSRDAAQWAYERAVADAWRDEVVLDDNHSNAWPRVWATEGSAGHAREMSDAISERNYTVLLASDQKDWVAAAQAIHVSSEANGEIEDDATLCQTAGRARIVELFEIQFLTAD